MSTPRDDVDEAQTDPKKAEVQLDPQFQARLLAQMREEQEANIRRTTVLNWIIVPLTLVALVVGIVLAFSDDHLVAVLANLVASSIAYVLYRVNRPRIRAFLGLE